MLLFGVGYFHSIFRFNMSSVKNIRTLTSMWTNAQIPNYFPKGLSAKIISFQNVSRQISTSVPSRKAVTIRNMNSAIMRMRYAVRGPIVTRAMEIEKELREGVKKPFDRVIRANLGDAQALGQNPITYIRQVLALVSFPELLNDPSGQFPEDVKYRAKTILASCRGNSSGAYTDSPGIEIIRKHVAQYIDERDDFPSDWNNVLLFDGASNAIKAVLKLFNDQLNAIPAGMMIPIPQYPLYSATLAELGMTEIGYYLDEDKGWSLEVEELQRAYDEAKKTCDPRALCVINPGNPTGQVLTKENIERIVKFAQKHDLFIFADEVYKDNVYFGELCSFKKVMSEMGPPYSEVELASFLSASKGYTGECGMRGGAVEIVNMDAEVKQMLLKSVSAMLCPNVLGQTVMDCVCRPPIPGEPSYEKFKNEKDEILNSLALRAEMISEAFNSFPNMSCNKVQGAMYAFPKMELPELFITKAASRNTCPSNLYCFELLEETGICTVPGDGFRQKHGTYHFRTTILPQPPLLQEMLDRMKDFHIKFLNKYADT